MKYIMSAEAGSSRPCIVPALSSDSGIAPPPAGVARTEKQVLKRNACDVCRKRKLRCDGDIPKCGRCSRLGHDCVYNDARKRSGPRRGYVRSLEARLAQLEGLVADRGGEQPQAGPEIGNSQIPTNEQFPKDGFDEEFLEPEVWQDGQAFVPESLLGESQLDFGILQSPREHELPDKPLGTNGFSWELIELGIDEPLPPQDDIDELTELYFTKVHLQVPIIHRYRFLAAMDLAPYARPPAALRYAMWALAASISDKYRHLHTVFHYRARKYAEADQMTGRYRYINMRHVQAWMLVGIYEFKMMHFPNAWMTTGRATRLAQMLNLNRLDGLGLDVKQTLPAPLDWSEKEERRRTFWMVFCMDRYAGVGTGWPMIIDERDIMTNLPSSEEAFAQILREEPPSISIREAMNPTNASKLSAFAGVVIVVSLTGRNLEHLQRASPNDDDDDLNGEFWKEHRKMDDILCKTSLGLPAHLRLPAGLSNPNKIFLNMSLQAGIICLHQAGIFKAEKYNLPMRVITESKLRCLAAATEICSIMKMIAHMDLSMIHVNTPFTLYVATRIFAEFSKSNPEDDVAISSVRFLLSALSALKDMIPLAESYLLQLDLEGSGLNFARENVRGVSGLEKDVAHLSVVEDTSDESWVTFVSPLIRIVERSGNGSSVSPTPSTAHPVKTSSTSPSALFNSSSGASPTGPEAYFNATKELSNVSDDMTSLPLNGRWGSSDVNIEDSKFDSSMDFEARNWE